MKKFILLTSTLLISSTSFANVTLHKEYAFFTCSSKMINGEVSYAYITDEKGIKNITGNLNKGCAYLLENEVIPKFSNYSRAQVRNINTYLITGNDLDQTKYLVRDYTIKLKGIKNG